MGVCTSKQCGTVSAFAILLCFLFSSILQAQEGNALEANDTIQPAYFKGGKEGLAKYIKKNLRYPPEVGNNKIKGKVLVGFTVSETGEIKDAFVKESLEGTCDFEALRLVKRMPNWSPATVNNQVIESQEQLYISFLDGIEFKHASFPKNGNKGLMQFIGQNLKYPKDAQWTGKDGKVVVSFLITKEGYIEDAEIRKTAGKELDDEALRVVNLMPKWKPATENGEAVETYYSIPILFRLRDSKNKYDKLNSSKTLYVQEGKVVYGEKSVHKDYLKYSTRITDFENVVDEHKEYVELAQKLGKTEVVILETKAEAIQRKIRKR